MSKSELPPEAELLAQMPDKQLADALCERAAKYAAGGMPLVGYFLIEAATRLEVYGELLKAVEVHPSEKAA